MACPAVMNVQAKTERMWVVSEITTDYSSETVHRFYSYDHNGLLKKEDAKRYYGKEKTQYTYDKHHHIKTKKHKSILSEDGSSSSQITHYTTNRKGLVTSRKEEGDQSIHFTYKNGLIVKDQDYTYQYNQKGQRVSMAGQIKAAYKYDKRGYITRISEGGKTSVTFKNKYNKRKLLSSVSYSFVEGGPKFRPNTFKYKKIKINSQLKSEIIRQQNALTNKNGYILGYIDVDSLYY